MRERTARQGVMGHWAVRALDGLGNRGDDIWEKGSWLCARGKMDEGWIGSFGWTFIPFGASVMTI